MSTNLLQRIAFAVVAIPAALGLVWLGGLPLALFLGVTGALGTRELYGLASYRGVHALDWLGVAGAGLVAPVMWFSLTPGGLGSWLVAWWPFLAIGWLIAALLVAVAQRAPAEQPLSAVAVTVFGVLYCAVLPGFLLVIRHTGFGVRSWDGTWLVFFPLVVVWTCDTAAMFAGKVIGGPKLAPVVSPGKTRVGGVAGVVGGVIAAFVYQAIVLDPRGIELTAAQILVFGLLASIVGQAGDLAESLFKREAGVKDSSTLIPGHGGVLDRFDSLYVVLPLAAGLFRFFGVY